MKIVLQKKQSKKIEDFFDKEWDIADIEHYGCPSNWYKKDFTLVAKGTDQNKVSTY